MHHHPANNLATFSRLRQLPVHDISVIVLKTAVDPTQVSPMTGFICLPKPYQIPPAKKRQVKLYLIPSTYGATLIVQYHV